MRTLSSPLRFSALICHNEGGRRCRETGVRIFRYELTNSTRQYPLGRVVCPQSGLPGQDHPAVAATCQRLQELARMTKEQRLEEVRKLIRSDSQHWQIGEGQPGDLKDECLADRGERLLQESTADVIPNSDGSLSMIMDYDLDLRGISLTRLLEERKRQARRGPFSRFWHRVWQLIP